MKSVKHKYISGQKFEVSWRGKLLLRQNTSTHICSEVDICTSSKYIAESNTDLYFHRKYKYRLQWWTALEEYFHIDRKYCNKQNMKELPVELSPNWVVMSTTQWKASCQTLWRLPTWLCVDPLSTTQNWNETKQKKGNIQTCHKNIRLVMKINVERNDMYCIIMSLYLSLYLQDCSALQSFAKLHCIESHFLPLRVSSRQWASANFSSLQSTFFWQ